MAKPSILPNLIRTLGLLVLEYDGSNRFISLAELPDWFSKLYDNHLNHSPDKKIVITQQGLCDAFPFLDNFLIDAHAYWSKNNSAMIVGSGVWTEQDNRAKEYQLEARAMLIDNQPVLLIENLSQAFEERHTIYQKARDMALVNEKLISELNFRQRKLQSDIERHLTMRQPVSDLSHTVEGNTSAVLVCLPDGNVELYNRALVNIYEVSSDEKLSRSSMLDKWIHEAEQLYPEIHRSLKAGSYWEGEFETRGAGDSEKWIRLSIGPVKNEAGQLTHYVCIANDLSDYRKISDDWGNIADYDFNTHLPNRRQFWKHITQVCESGQQSDEHIALMYIDLDYFKRINDQHGQFGGDFLLGTMASRLSRNIKHGDYIAHLGGDEFVILLRFISNTDDLVAVGERILVTISEPINLDGAPIRCTASIGIATSSIAEANAHELLRNADLAMYSAKELGRSQIRIYSSELETNLPHRSQREHELLEAIDQEQFVLEYQPQISMGNDKTLRVEALVRWQHPKFGELNPSEFIGIAEDCGSIVPIGDWVLQSACRQGKQFIDQGLPVRVAVNISAKQLRHPKFYDKLKETLDETQFLPEYLELEITESSFLKEMNRVVEVLHKVRTHGIMVALDDFGSGFSSLNYLKRLPVDFIKIDRSFIHDLPNDNESKAITTSVIHLAHQLDMKVIAEGVETVQQLEFLEDNNVDFVQGFYFFRPMKADQIKGIKWSK